MRCKEALKDKISLLTSIVRSYNKCVLWGYDSLRLDFFIQYSQLKRIMQQEGYIFTAKTTPMNGSFVFLSLAFSADYLERFPVLSKFGFSLDGDMTVLHFNVDELKQATPKGKQVGVIGGGHVSLEEAVAGYFKDNGLDASSPYAVIVQVGEGEEEISC